MAESAQITSVEAIESFRSKLIEFISQMRPALGEVGSEVLRTRVWLQDEHRRHWENELRLRSRRLEEAKQELFNATMAQLNDAAALHRMTMQRMQRAVQEAEAKLLVLKKWSRELENRTAPLMKQVDQLYGFLAVDMVRGVAHLDEILKALEAYRNVNITPAATGPLPDGGASA
jgi:hypothetical protein